jgi:hypothetical protein
MQLRRLAIGERLTISQYLEQIRIINDLESQLARYQGEMPEVVRHRLVIKLGDARANRDEIYQSIVAMSLTDYVHGL